jgi:hypothetical protein
MRSVPTLRRPRHYTPNPTVLFGAALLLFSAASLNLSAGAPQGKGKTPSTIPTIVEMSDRSGDAITSDGGGTYANGESGIVSNFLTNSGDMSLILSSSGRMLRFDYTDRVSSTGPVGMTTDPANMNIVGIWNMGIGSSISTRAIFAETSVGQFTFDRPSGTQVLVTREDAHTWTVDSVPNGGLAALIQPAKHGSITAGVYDMPFALTINCASCQ